MIRTFIKNTFVVNVVGGVQVSVGGVSALGTGEQVLCFPVFGGYMVAVVAGLAGVCGVDVDDGDSCEFCFVFEDGGDVLT